MDPQAVQHRKILIVDDEEGVRNLLRDILSAEFECVLSGSAEEAISLFDTTEFCLVVSDINLGGMSGVEMIPLVRDRSRDTVVVMISGDQTVDTAIDAMRLGAFDYVRKPFDVGHVLAAARRAVRHHELLIAKREYEEDLERLVRERTEQLKFLTLHDALTGLPNRLLIEDRLGRLVLKNADHDSVAVLLVSLDRMNQIRGMLGPDAADELMKDAADRIASIAGSNTVGRLEGDVLAILVPRTAAEAVVTLSGKFVNALSAPFALDAGEIFLRPGLGVSIFPGDGANARELLRNAGLALSQARDSAAPAARFYKSGVNEFATERLAFESDLRRAIERDELTVHYQPIIETASGRVTGVEALVRWLHPTRGVVSPCEFIPAAESIGVIAEIGEWVLRRACQDFAGRRLNVAVNVSRHQLQEPGLAATVAKMLTESRLAPELLHLEVTEASVMQNPAASIARLSAVRDLGVRVALDDFGTGYSSLNALKDLPVDILKIDRSFISDVSENESDAAFVNTIIGLARNLRLGVVAEGVETEKQLALLDRLGCNEWQGFLSSPPVPLDEFLALLNRTEVDPEIAAVGTPKVNELTIR